MADITSKLQSVVGPAPFGVGLPHFITACAVLLLSLALLAVIRPVLSLTLLRKRDEDKNALRQRVVDAIVPPLRVLPLTLGIYIVLHILHLSGKGSVVAGEVLKSVFVAAIVWALLRLLASSNLFSGRLHLKLEPSAQRWVRYALQILFALCGLAIILEIWNIPVAPLIGSLGVFGIAVGLAAKDLFSNLISGLLLMTEKRFGPGDWIKVDGIVEGTVEEINFRSTLLRRFDLSPVYVPNSLLADNATTNFSRMTFRRINWMIGLEYGTPPDKLEEIRDGIESWLKNDKRICQPPEASLFVRIDSFGDSSINLMICCFTRTTVWAEWLAIKEEFALAMIPIVNGAGSGFAFPTRSVILQRIDAPEIINPESGAQTSS